jgi:hypothetical protein
MPTIPATPEVRRGFRNKDYVQPVAMRLGTGFVDALDDLCAVNNRSRRQIVEILIERATRDYLRNPNARLVAP